MTFAAPRYWETVVTHSISALGNIQFWLFQVFLPGGMCRLFRTLVPSGKRQPEGAKLPGVPAFVLIQACISSVRWDLTPLP